MVTLRKEERDFSPTTRYRDYPIAADLFHWESQNSTSRDSATGRRYLAGTSRVILFVRPTLKDDMGSAPYLCLGEGTLVEHRGERPIAITWRLRRPMPPEVLQQGSVASTSWSENHARNRGAQALMDACAPFARAARGLMDACAPS